MSGLNGWSKAMPRTGLLALTSIVLALWQTTAYAQMSHQHASEAACEEAVLRCASKVTPAFGPDGTLWLAWMAGGEISVAGSKDAGKSFSPPVQVTREKLNLAWGPDARPKIVVDKSGGIALALSTFWDTAVTAKRLHPVRRRRPDVCRVKVDHVQQRKPAFRSART
jgi:hypothetical protein